MQQLQSINKPFLDQIVTCNEKWIVYDNQQQTSSVVGSRRRSKVLPKAKLVPKKVVVTLWWSAASLTHYSFLNPSETITSEKYAQQIDEIHQKLHLQPALVNRKGLIILYDNA